MIAQALITDPMVIHRELKATALAALKTWECNPTADNAWRVQLAHAALDAYEAL